MEIDPVCKEIIDNHVSKYYRYYKGECAKYFTYNDLLNDMLHNMYEAFLKVNPETIKKFHEANKLQCIGHRILLSLYTKRNQGNKYANKKTSELHQIPSINRYDINLADEPYDTDIDETHDKLNSTVSKLLRNNETWFSTQVFVQCQEISILELSKRTKISRDYLTKAYKKGHKLLLNEMK